jgi:tetratricopeptide (TPR) repeat protein
MKKKATVKVKASAAKSHKNKPAQQLLKKDSGKRKSAVVNTPARPLAPLKPTEDPRFQQAVQAYEQALKAIQAQKFDRAKPLLEKVLSSGSKELADRAAMHLNICNQQLERNHTKFNTPAEQYDYAISLMNLGDYVGAREHLEKLVKSNPKLDYAWYGYSVLECLTGHYPEALQHLTEAIRLNNANRFQARNDSDFQNLADDPRFTELLYPEGASL